MRFKLPGRSDTDSTPGPEVPPAHQQTGMSTIPMPEQTPPPLTSELTRSIRFTISEPQGYFFEQVETFVAQVVEVLDYYEQIDYRWRQTLYDMQVESDQQAFDNQRLRSEIELFKVQGSPLVNNDGSYVTESQQGAFESVSADLVALRDQLSASEHARISGTEETNRLQDLVAMQEQEISALRAWGTQVIADMQTLQGNSESLEAHIAALEAQIRDLTTARAPQPAPAPAALEAAVTAVEAPVVPVAPVIVPLAADVVAPEAVTYDESPAPGQPDFADLDFPDVMPDVAVPDGQIYVTDESEQPEAATPALVPVNWTPEATHPEHQHTEPVPAQPQEYAPVPDVAPEAAYEHGENGYEASPVEAVVEVGANTWAPEAPVDTYADATSAPEAAAPVVEHSPSEPVPEHGPDSLPIEDLYDPEAEDVTAQDYTRFEVDADGVEDVQSTWSPDSELPEGVALPGTGEAAVTYPPAAPGVPLETHGIPMEMWAPELDPKIQEMVRNQQAAPTQQASPTAPAAPVEEPASESGE